MCVSVPEKSVSGRAPVGDVVEENLQFVVIVEVCSDDGAHRRRHGELLRRDVLQTMTHHKQSATRTYACCPSISARTGVFFFFEGNTRVARHLNVLLVRKIPSLLVGTLTCILKEANAARVVFYCSGSHHCRTPGAEGV